jgi:hypothetical protein
MADEQATRDWYTRAQVRVKAMTTKRAPESGEHTFSAGQEIEMLQWGRAGREVDRSVWWTSFDIDGAFILDASEVDVVKILDETLPYDEPALARCPYCQQWHEPHLIESCPLAPKHL